VSDGRLYVRNQDTLLVYDIKAGAALTVCLSAIRNRGDSGTFRVSLTAILSAAS
jgi:hypothetical protein